MSRRKETNYIIIHSTNTKPNVDLSARDIDEKHRKKGLLKIGYHCVVKRDGTIDLGRPFNEIGAHLQSHDHESIGICIVGGLNTRGVVAPDYTKEQFKSLFFLLNTLKYVYTKAKIVGHRDVDSGECPSFNVSEWFTGAIALVRTSI
jgi:N-acetyl-anhydromuramyl-L-alanine amidase AmpD